MKLFYKVSLCFLLLGSFLKAQDKSVFKPEPEIKIYGNFSLAFGDNMLGKAHEAKIGWGFMTSPFSLYNFKLGVGFDFTKFDVTNSSLAGNVNRTELLNLYGYVAYPIVVTKKIAIEPKLGIGGNKLRQKTGSDNFGNMKGTSLIIGSSIEYEVVYPLEIFAGTDFVQTKFNVETHPDNEKFFQNASQFTIYLGLKFNIGKNKNKKEER